MEAWLETAFVHKSPFSLLSAAAMSHSPSVFQSPLSPYESTLVDTLVDSPAAPTVRVSVLRPPVAGFSLRHQKSLSPDSILDTLFDDGVAPLLRRSRAISSSMLTGTKRSSATSASRSLASVPSLPPKPGPRQPSSSAASAAAVCTPRPTAFVSPSLTTPEHVREREEARTVVTPSTIVATENRDLSRRPAADWSPATPCQQQWPRRRTCGNDGYNGNDGSVRRASIATPATVLTSLTPSAASEAAWDTRMQQLQTQASPVRGV